MTSITIRLELEEKEAIATYAEKNDLTMSQVVRRAVREFLKEQEEKQ